jgi:UDP-glucuronate 4-epimerase
MTSSGRDERFLVTGAMGCLGAWVVRLLLDEGTAVVGLDLSTNRSRLRLIVDDDRMASVTLASGDIAEEGVVDAAIRTHGISHVVHCAALQVPFVRADPPRGARVNVLGTVNVFEAVAASDGQVRGFAYASSAAVYGPPDRYPEGIVDDRSPHVPDGNLYAVFKEANELMARVYARDAGVISVGLRPFVVYGPGRDQGMTSTPTVAMLAALAGVPYRISFRGPMYFNFAPDAAAAFIAAARADAHGPTVANVPGTTATVEEVVELIEAELPEARGLLSVADDELAAPSRVDTTGTAALLGRLEVTPMETGVAWTIDAFRSGLRRGLLEPPGPPARS